MKLTEEEYQDCVDTFRFLDTNDNEKIELNELCNGLSDLGLDLTSAEITSLLSHFGKESHEYLNFEEYANFYQECVMGHEVTKEEVIKLFNDTDLNKDGRLDLIELKGMLIEKGISLTDDEIHVLLRDYDYNNDSKLNLEEFIDALYGSIN
jgi:Ca2+-binding EF-hand superfamily protein